MHQLIGILIAINCIIICGWWISTGHGYKGWFFFVCMLGVFFGIFLILQERAIEITIKGIGSIKAAAEQAVVDARQIKELRERIEAQSATVDLVAKSAMDAKNLSTEAQNISKEAKQLVDALDRKNETANKKLQEIEEEIKKVNSISDELQSIARFTTVVIAAQNNDRKAFDQLDAWANDKSNPFAQRALEAYSTIMDEHSKPYFMSGYKIPWKEGFDPSSLTLDNLKDAYKTAPVHLRSAFIEYIWGRQELSKKQRMQFLIDIIEKDDNLIAIEYAGRYFTQGADLKIKPLAIEYLMKWWKENKDKIN